jgi:hypothetical protein
MRNEKRGRLRLGYTTQVLLTAVDSEKTLEATLANISMSGLYANATEQLPLDIICLVQVVLTGSDSNLTMNAKGVVVRSDSDGTGIQFIHDIEWWPVFSMYKGKGKKPV